MLNPDKIVKIMQWFDEHEDTPLSEQKSDLKLKGYSDEEINYAARIWLHSRNRDE